VPRIKLAEAGLHFGDCYLRHAYVREMVLVNESKLPAHFDVAPQDMQSQALAVLEASPCAGDIPPKGTVTVTLTLRTNRLGRIQLPVLTRVQGSRSQPLELVAEARSIGPYIEFGPPEGPHTRDAALAFGKVEVLREHTQTVTMHNPCPIPAPVKLFVESSASAFSVEPAELTMEPGGSAIVTIVAFCDDVISYADTLHALVAEGADAAVTMSAAGTGVNILAEELRSDMDFGVQLTTRATTRTVMIFNAGFLPATLSWEMPAVDAAMTQAAREKSLVRSRDGTSTLPDHLKPVRSRAAAAAAATAAGVWGGYSVPAADAQRTPLTFTPPHTPNQNNARLPPTTMPGLHDHARQGGAAAQERHALHHHLQHLAARPL